MNLIEISEQLKDVPDQYLMKEVQAPSGAYPAYLIVAEMGRRKRMRDTAMKERPQTTVAQDLTQPSPEQLRAAMAQMQQPQQMSGLPQMAPEVPQAQMMSQPTPRLNAGLMATPQAAQELSAQDAMAAQPVGMAAGGMVAFNEGGKVKKFDDRGAVMFQNQGLVPRYGMSYEDLQEYDSGPAGSIGDLFGRFSERRRIDPVTGEPIYIAEFLRRKEAERIAAARPEAQAIVNQMARSNPQALINIAQASPQTALDMAKKDAVIAQRLGELQSGTKPPSQLQQSQAASPTQLKDQVPKPPSIAMPTYTDPFQAQMSANLSAMQALREPTEQDILASRTRGAEEYERMVPDRATPMMQEAISRQEKDIEGRRGSAFNEMLMEAGLGIMGSKSPRFAQAVSEGGMGALRGYREGMKDIRQGERDLMKSRVDLANAQSLRDQNKFSAADKAEERGLNAYKRGMERLNTESAIIARNQNAAYQQFQAQLSGVDKQIALAKLPGEMRETAARAGYYEQGGRGGASKISDADQKAAEEFAMREAMLTPGIKFGTPEFQAKFEERYQYHLNRRAGTTLQQPLQGQAEFLRIRPD
jgi:hypothetical protein